MPRSYCRYWCAVGKITQSRGICNPALAVIIGFVIRKNERTHAVRPYNLQIFKFSNLQIKNRLKSLLTRINSAFLARSTTKNAFFEKNCS